MADANAVGQVVMRGAQGARSAASKAEHGGSAFDVWTHAKEGQAEAAGQTADLLNMPLAPIESGTSVGALPTAMGQQVDALKQAAADFGKAKGALATAGAVMGALTTLEQAISTPLSAIPFPAYPAIRVMDMDVGLPHAHNHPPNLVPPAPPVPLPSTGPVIPIPYVSGAATVLINGMPAGRCGDMGMGIWCGSYFPMYEIFLGSSSVWIEGMRAARLGVDITKHCIFSVPKPQDLPIGPMIGMTISSSANVVIGGVPMPSLTNMAIGAAINLAFKGFGKVVRGLRVRGAAVAAARAAAEAEAKAAAEAAARMAVEGDAKAAVEAAAKTAAEAQAKAAGQAATRATAKAQAAAAEARAAAKATAEAAAREAAAEAAARVETKTTAETAAEAETQARAAERVRRLPPLKEEKILTGERVANPKSPGGMSNEIIGGHSPRIKNRPEFLVEQIRRNPDGTTYVLYVKGYPDGKLSKLKYGHLAPDSWSDAKIIDATHTVADAPPVATRARDGATLHRQVVDGIEWEVIRDENGFITSSYPTGGDPTNNF